MFVALFDARSANEKRKQADRKVCLQAPINVASAKKRHRSLARYIAICIVTFLGLDVSSERCEHSRPLPSLKWALEVVLHGPLRWKWIIYSL